jgi:hypothetical protein
MQKRKPGQPHKGWKAAARQTYVMRNGELVPKRLAEPLNIANAAPMVMGDLPEYRAVAADKSTGKRPMIGGRRQHREFLQRNGYVEIGNEMPTARREEMPRSDRIQDIRRALGD